MSELGQSRYALTIGVAAALLVGCAAQGSTPAAGAAAARSVRMHHLTGSGYQVLYRFTRYPDGAHPMAGLIDVKGTLYGTAFQGGKNCERHHLGKYGCGTVYSITPSGVENLLYDFDPAQQGAFPETSLTNVKGTLYGTTYKGGLGVGTVYSITTGGSESVVYSFQGAADGSHPDTPLLNVKGTLYGTTEGGGRKHGRSDGAMPGLDVRYPGTVYSVSTSGVHTVLYKFKAGSDGDTPSSGLVNVNGTLYGTTLYGGTAGSKCQYGCGTVYSMTPEGSEHVVYRFAGGTDGDWPTGTLVDVDGTLYGTTRLGGGSCDCGTVYSVTTSGQEKVLYSFAGGSDGETPQGGLIDVDGTLYGTTAYGGNLGVGCNDSCGTIYSVSTAGAESVLYRFAGGTDGAHPEGLLLDVHGTLYGTTEFGGKAKADCCGTVFALTP